MRWSQVKPVIVFTDANTTFYRAFNFTFRSSFDNVTSDFINYICKLYLLTEIVRCNRIFWKRLVSRPWVRILYLNTVSKVWNELCRSVCHDFIDNESTSRDSHKLFFCQPKSSLKSLLAVMRDYHFCMPSVLFEQWPIFTSLRQKMYITMPW